MPVIICKTLRAVMGNVKFVAKLTTKRIFTVNYSLPDLLKLLLILL